MTAFRAAGFVLLGVALFLGLPLLGWGVDDARGFYAHPARTAYAVLVVLHALLLVVVAVKIPQAGRSRGQQAKLVRRQRLTLGLIRVLTLAMVLWAPYCDRREIGVLAEGTTVRVVGLGLYVAGFVWMLWALAVLGKQFSLEVTIQEGHELVTAGPYRYIRHPRYLGILVFMLGFALVFRSWLTVAAVLGLTLLLLWRIHDEEGLLRREFGAEWEAYARRSWRLVPFVY
jgi:protein-S-isoprenylcysteine O-methyltransferase Ste14